MPTTFMHTTSGILYHYAMHATTYNYIQLLTTTYNYIQLHATTYNYMQLHATTYNYLQLHTTTYNYLQLHTTTYNYSQLYTTSYNYIQLYTTTYNWKHSVTLIMVLFRPHLIGIGYFRYHGCKYATIPKVVFVGVDCIEVSLLLVWMFRSLWRFTSCSTLVIIITFCFQLLRQVHWIPSTLRQPAPPSFWSNPQFPMLDFLALLFRFTFKQVWRKFICYRSACSRCTRTDYSCRETCSKCTRTWLFM